MSDVTKCPDCKLKLIDGEPTHKAGCDQIDTDLAEHGQVHIILEA